MKYNYFKLAVIFLLGALLAVYTNCGKPFSDPSNLWFQSNVYGGGSQASYNAFEKTVYPITRANCVSCHAEQQPMHAADDVTIAHDEIIKTGKVNWGNIPKSRLVLKLREDSHNCWGDCAANADEMEEAIEEWNEAIKSSGVVTNPVAQVIYTEETGTLESEFADSSNPLKSNSVKLNVESAMLRAPMTRVMSADGPYLTVANAANTTLTATDANAGTASMSFTVPATGQYRIWGLAHGPADADNSFFVNVRNAASTIIGGTRTWDIPVGTKFDWRQVQGGTFNLTQGTAYTLELRQREDGARASSFIITSDTTFNGTEVGDYFGITLSFDLSGVLNSPGISLKIDVIDYDLYSYKFSRPRIVTPASSVYAKGLKIYVNNSYSPQHSTYTLVDKIVTPGDQVLSDYSMIVIKDRGMAGDHIKFSFDQLSLSTGGSTVAGATAGSTGGTTGQTSLMAFQETVYPISRSSTYSCVGCHMAVSPRHASDNTLTAHDAALTVVDFNNPQNSRIVTKMRTDRHNCGANCDQIANLYQSAIQEWKNRRQ